MDYLYFQRRWKAFFSHVRNISHCDANKARGEKQWLSDNTAELLALAGESLISQSARFVWQLPPCPRGKEEGLAGQHVLPKLLTSLWSWTRGGWWVWAAHGCMSLELCLDLHMGVTSCCWQESQQNMQWAPRWRIPQPCKLPQGSLQLQRAMGRSEDRAGLGAALPLLGREEALCYFFLFSSREVTDCYKWKGRKAVLCLCPPCRGMCRKDRSYTLQSVVC